MNNSSLRAILVMGAFFVLAGCQPSSKEPAIAKIGDTSITASDFSSRLHDAPPAYQQYTASPEGRRQFLNLLIREKVLLAEAKRAGLEKNDDYKTAVARFKKKWERDFRDYQESLLIEMSLARLRSKDINVTDADIRRYYDEHSTDFTHPIEIQASHILVVTSDEAEQALARIKSGQSFENVAHAMSTDPSTAARGGKLTPYIKGNMLTEFESAVDSLKDGQVSGVVKSPFGYHIIKKNSQRSLPARSFETAKNEIRSRLERDKFDQWVTKAQASLGVKIDEQALASVVMVPPQPTAGRTNGERSVQ